MIGCYVDELKEGFFPYVKQVADIMVPLLKFYFHEDVRRAAVQAVPQLLRAASAAADKGVAGAGREFNASLFQYTYEPLVAALRKEPDADIQSAMLEALAEVVDLVEPSLLGAPQVEAAFDGVRHALKLAERRREARAKRLLQEDFDEEEAEALREENECEDELVDQVGVGDELGCVIVEWVLFRGCCGVVFVTCLVSTAMPEKKTTPPR
jgi:hypothetical protein